MLKTDNFMAQQVVQLIFWGGVSEVAEVKAQERISGSARAERDQTEE